MLLWQVVERDADIRLNTQDGALTWLAEFAPELWRETSERRGGSVHREPIHGWEFDAEGWQQWRAGVRAVRDIAQARAACASIPATARRTANGFIERHIRHRLPPDAEPGDQNLELCPFLVRHGENGAEVVSEVTTDGRFDCPHVLMAYCLGSMFDVNIAGFGGGRCPKCGRGIGNTPKGKPRSGMCERCKAAQWRSEHLDESRKRVAKAMKESRQRKKDAAEGDTNSNTEGD